MGFGINSLEILRNTAIFAKWNIRISMMQILAEQRFDISDIGLIAPALVVNIAEINIDHIVLVDKTTV